MLVLYMIGLIIYLFGSILLFAIDKTILVVGVLCVASGLGISFYINTFRYKTWEARIYTLIGYTLCVLGVFASLLALSIFTDETRDDTKGMSSWGTLISGVLLFGVGMKQIKGIRKEHQYIAVHGDSRLKPRRGFIGNITRNDIISTRNTDYSLPNKTEFDSENSKQNRFNNRSDFKDFKHFSMEDIDSICSIETKKRKGDLFEQYCARLLELNMFSYIKVVGGSGDMGVDIIAWKGRKKVAIQCKCYSHTVPYHALEQIVTARKNVMASEAILITNNYFSNQTKELAPEHQIYLWDRDKLQKLIDVANEICAEDRLPVVDESQIS